MIGRRLTPATRALGGQASWSVLDQAASSLGTLVLSVVVARASDLDGFGAFAIAFMIYTLVLTGSRALLTMPYMMDASDGAAGHDSRLAAGVLGAVGAVSLLLAAGLAVAGALVAGPLGPYLLLMAAGLPPLLLQDGYRFVLLQRQGSRPVATNDAAWTALQVTLSVLVALTPVQPAAALHVVAWIVGAAAAGIWARWRTGIAPDLREGVRFVARTRRTGVPLLVEAFAISGSGASANFAVAAVGGLAAVAPLRGAAVVLGPVSVATGGLLFLATPMVLRVGAHDKARLLVLCAGFGAVVAAVSLVTAFLVVLVPPELGVLLMGEVFLESRPVVVPVALAIAAYALKTAAMLGFRAHRVTVRTMVLNLVVFPLPAVSATAGLGIGGPAGAAYGIAAAALLTSAVLWWMLVLLPAAPPGTAPPEAPADTSGSPDAAPRGARPSR